MKSSSQCHTLENIIIFPAYILDAIQRAWWKTPGLR
jgi:hypothetical protein